MNVEQELVQVIEADLKIQQIVIDDYTINYVTAGSGKPLLLIHALNMGWGEWYSNIAELAKVFTVYAIDLPGSGRSTKIDFGRMSFERDFVEVVEKFIQQKKLKGVNIIGHSSGGLLALKLAQRKKVSINRLVAVSPMGFTDEVPFTYKLLSIFPLAKFLSKTVMRPTRKNIHEFLTSVMQNKDIKEEFVNYYLDSIAKNTRFHPFLLINGFLRGFKLKRELLIKNGDTITNSTLIIVGDKDPNILPFDSHQVQSVIPKVQIEVFFKCGHVPSIEYSALFNQKVIQFIH